MPGGWELDHQVRKKNTNPGGMPGGGGGGGGGGMLTGHIEPCIRMQSDGVFY